MSNPLPRPLIFLIGGLLLVNLLQAFATGLIYDEAYYWYYSLSPSWGYFDHPPMVAWMVGLGYSIFQNELGVRLVGCLMGAGTALLIWSLVEHPEKKTYYREFFVWVLSIVLLHAYGFLTLPDTPLLFFTALFLWLYRRFVKEPGFGIALLLGVCMAAMMYSKYHAALIIVFVLLSNLSLLKNKYAWLALVVSLLCYLPHLNWLYSNDFVSLEFHLFERPNEPYDFTKFTLVFFLNLMALFGLTFPFAYRAAFKFKADSPLEKAMKYIFLGMLIFFFVSSFQRRIQTQWLITICIPVAAIVTKSFIEQPNLRKWIWRLGLANILILAWLRIGLVYEPVFPGRYESHGNKIWVENLKTLAAGTSVVFENSYRAASMYSFYAQEPAISLDNAYYRKDQYAINGSEALVQGKKVFYAYKGREGKGPYYLDARGTKHYGVFIENFESFRDLKSGLPKGEPLNADNEYPVWIYNPYNKSIPLRALRLGVAYLDGSKRLQEIRPVHTNFRSETRILPKDTLWLNVVLPAPEKSEPVFVRMVISENELPWGLNGRAQPIKP